MFSYYADSMFGKLARFLRMLGFDTKYRKEETVDEMLDLSKLEGRVVLSSSAMVNSKCKKLRIQSIKLSSTDISEQLEEVEKTLDFIIPFPPKKFRCSLCNGNLTSVNKSSILDRIPEGTSKTYEEFWECESCSQIFWLGSHWEDIKRILQERDK